MTTFNAATAAEIVKSATRINQLSDHRAALEHALSDLAGAKTVTVGAVSISTPDAVAQIAAAVALELRLCNKDLAAISDRFFTKE